MRVKPPCYDEQRHTDCPRRYIGCKSDCVKWFDYLAAKKDEQDRIKANRDRYYEAEVVSIEQHDRVKKSRHRDYMRDYMKERRR